MARWDFKGFPDVGMKCSAKVLAPGLVTNRSSKCTSGSSALYGKAGHKTHLGTHQMWESHSCQWPLL